MRRDPRPEEFWPALPDGRFHGCSGRAGQFVGRHGLEGPGDPARPSLERPAIRCAGTASGHAEPLLRAAFPTKPPSSAEGEFVVPLIQFFLSKGSGATMAHCEGKEPREAGEGLWARPHPPEEVRSALKIVAHYYGIDPIDLEGLLDSIAPLLSADD